MIETLPIGQQAVAQIPWGHNFFIFKKKESHTEPDIPTFHLQSGISIWQKPYAKLKFLFFIASGYRPYPSSKTGIKKKFPEWIEQQEKGE